MKLYKILLILLSTTILLSCYNETPNSSSCDLVENLISTFQKQNIYLKKRIETFKNEDDFFLYDDDSANYYSKEFRLCMSSCLREYDSLHFANCLSKITNNKTIFSLINNLLFPNTNDKITSSNLQFLGTEKYHNKSLKDNIHFKTILTLDSNKINPDGFYEVSINTRYYITEKQLDSLK